MSEKAELQRLAAFLKAEYPRELGRGTEHHAETAVEVAIRLLNNAEVAVLIDELWRR